MNNNVLWDTNLGDVAVNAALLAGAAPGTVVNLKAAVYDAAGKLVQSSATVAAAGSDQAGAAGLTAQTNVITGADNAKGVRLPAALANAVIVVVNTDATHILKVYPASGGAINALGADAAFSIGPDNVGVFVGRSASAWFVSGQSSFTAPVANLDLFTQGVAAGYKVARGVHQQAAASDTVVTGLTSVVAVVASRRDAPTVKQMFLTASIGDQSGAPAAGSILINSYKPTAVNDVTPIAATDFSENLSVDWIAVGT